MLDVDRRMSIQSAILTKPMKPKQYAIALAVVLISGFQIPTLAQGEITIEGDSLENIDTSNNTNWTFTSEEEPISVKDDIKQLDTFSVSNIDSDMDVERSKERGNFPKWGNTGDVENRSFEVDVYQY